MGAATATALHVRVDAGMQGGSLTTWTVVSRNKFMHKATHIYLFNLAVSDLLVLLSAFNPASTWLSL
ncbi:pyrokinin-1 receptor-like [Rhagoletis pomonella]|uniref:pyrokinin-1 receptor-like n=1 Tax=Rhagoletis pomonella TaxID=28610 RepID=UPI00177EDE7E|nr:pyrokinin-1 receptor-like [Rhagoletis pomonella]